MPHESVITKPSTLAVWMPWLAAPLFCLLPIGGCAVANSLRETAARPAAAPPLVAVGPVVATASR